MPNTPITLTQRPSQRAVRRVAKGKARPGGVCIYGDLVADCFEGKVIGGAELQASLIAQALARAGYDVTVVDPRAGKEWITPDGIVVKQIPGWYTGIRGLRLFTHRIPGLLRVFLRRRAEIYYAQGFSFIFLVLYALSRVTGAKFVLQIASDLDLLGFWRRYQNYYRKNTSLWGYPAEVIPNHLTSRFILRNADVVLYQHPGQLPLLGRPGAEMPNVVPDELFEVPPRPRTASVLLVGLIAAHKGLRELLPCIRQLPDIRFELVGSPSGQDGNNIREQLLQCPNVVLHGQLPRAETLRKIAEAAVLVNVSPTEGFPNTFLEAWALGTPVLSLRVDPAGVIAKHGLGLVCGGDMRKLMEALRCGSYRVPPERLRAYVREYNSMEAATRIFHQATR